MTSSTAKTAPQQLHNLLPALIELSREYGADPDIVLGGGGNTSVKADGHMLIKASGSELASVDAEDFIAVDQAALMALLDADVPDDPAELASRIESARLQPGPGPRPSVECILHALLPQTFIVHTHPTVANILGCSSRAEALAAEWFGNDLVVAEYVDFGLPLARRMREHVSQYQASHGRPPSLMLVRNHGLFVAADSADEVRTLMNRVTATIAAKLPAVGDEPFGKVTRVDQEAAMRLILSIAPALRGLLAESETSLAGVCFDDSDRIVQFAGGTEGRKVTEAGAVTPDQVAYAGASPMWFDPPETNGGHRALVEALAGAINRHTDHHGAPPRVVLVPGLGMFATGRSPRGAQTAAAVYRQTIEIIAGAQALAGVNFLSDAQRRFVEQASGQGYGEPAGRYAPIGRVQNKVALVTGAAQGFGLEIAQHLAAEGAFVLMADINEQGAAEQAAAIVETHGPGRAIGLPVNVTDEQSVADCIEQAVRYCGGLDVLVSNAGVLKAESVKTQPLKDFQFVTAVNYTGYFLCVKHAAPVMAMQNAACPDARTDIIQINSKSGLTGSNRNAAYAGSKFGGIGLTQSFALELIEDGIKVNSICPGNFFDGPLWSDPENGLFVQYLRAGKVPGAQTIEDVKRAYEARVPMGRGCTTPDVMIAVYYLIEQRYETGQAVPVTGGQVMLS